MTNIIDSLVVEVGIDATKAQKGEADVAAISKRTKENLKKSGDEIETRLKGTTDSLGKLAERAAKYVAGFFAAEQVERIIAATIRINAQLGYVSRTLDTSVQDLSAWQNTVKFFGGTAEGATGSLQSLQSALEQLYLTGQSGVVPYFRALGVSLVDHNGKLKTALELYKELANNSRLQGLAKNDPARAAEILRDIGADQGTINAILAGPAAFNKAFATSLSRAPTGADAANAQKLAQSEVLFSNAVDKLASTFVTDITPSLTTFFNIVTGGLTTLQSAGGVTPAAKSGLLNLASSFLGLPPGIADVLANAFGSGSSGIGSTLTPSAVLGLIKKLEGGGDKSVSPKGAIGAYQIMPGTAAAYGYDPRRLVDPAYNKEVGLAIVTDLTKKFGGDLAQVLVAYNAGPGRVPSFNDHGLSGVPKETRGYLLHAARLGANLGHGIDGRSYSNSRTVSVGKIEVHTAAKTDKGTAKAVGSAIEEIGFSQSNYGMR